MGVSYLPLGDKASPIEAHARYFNYPAHSAVKSISENNQYGFKLIFFSNAFAAYRILALKEVRGFPSDVILGEDTTACAKLLLNGWKIAYQANATVVHSHQYTVLHEFKRYFDIGVLHAREAWLLEKFGTTHNEGYRFVRSELNYLSDNAILLIPQALFRTVIKLFAYRLGRGERYLPKYLKKYLSMNKNYWC